MEKLTDVSWVEHKLLPSLGLNDRHLHQMPEKLLPFCGGGIDSWQYPAQFSQYLTALSQRDVESYIEIGCHKGGTFIITVEFLSRFKPITRALAVDNWPRDIMHDYAEINPAVSYIPESSFDQRFTDALKSQMWDHILIDGDHSYEAAKKDFINCRDHARMLGFHDVVNVYCPGVQQLWSEVKMDEAWRCSEWTDQYDDVLLRIRGSIMGIGLAERNGDTS